MKRRAPTHPQTEIRSGTKKGGANGRPLDPREGGDDASPIRSALPNGGMRHLILASLNSTCLRARGSYFRTDIFSVIVRGFFFVT